MSQEKRTSITPRKPDPGFFGNLVNQLKLVLRLMGDSRVSFFVKLLPVGSLVYFLFPLDFLYGPIDDATLLGAGLYLFVELCPADVVEEHRAAILSASAGQESDAERVVDSEFKN